MVSSTVKSSSWCLNFVITICTFLHVVDTFVRQVFDSFMSWFFSLVEQIFLLLHLLYTDLVCLCPKFFRIMESAQYWARAAMSPPKYFLVTLLVSLGGFLNGIDTGTIGPVTQMPYFSKQFGVLEPTVQGIIVSAIMITAAITSFFSGDLSDTFGRPRAIAIGSLVYAIGAALETAAMNLAMLVAGRLIVGAGEGLFLSTLIVYTTEISPPRWRGALCTMVQLFITFGLVVGFFSCYGTVNVESTLSWRLPFALHCGVGICLTLGACFYLPHSPRWLSHHDRREEASKVWDDLGVSSAEREKDVLEHPVTAADKFAPVPESTSLVAAPGQRGGEPVRQPFTAPKGLRAKFQAFARIFAPDSRKATLLALFMVSMQQLSGIDGVIYYAPVLFKQAGLASSQANFLASGVSAICIFVFTIPAVIFADRWGRRPSTIYGGFALFVCMALMTLLYATNSVHGESGAARWVVIASIFIFAIVYSMTWSMSLRIFASEIQPMETRATATSLAQGMNCLTNFFVAFITPVLLAKSSYALYVLFSGCVALTIGVSIVYMPETKGKDLEAVREAFINHKTSNSVSWKTARRSVLGARTRIGALFARARGHASAGDGIELASRSQYSLTT